MIDKEKNKNKDQKLYDALRKNLRRRKQQIKKQKLKNKKD
tara:strand:- start:1189 stop:1308 length:120 start_codon:yes stop_codon:yes gene_type:complete